MKRFLLLVALAFFALSAAAQKTEYPAIGAQVFIEPGQDAAEIDKLFAILEDNGFKYARIRMFGAHFVLPDGYAIYDEAFAAADRHGIKIFATLFPPTDELTDVGGFKFPSSFAQLEEVDVYVRDVVRHFSNCPALYCWVLQNEPGTGKSSVEHNELSDSVRAAWLQEHDAYSRCTGWLRANYDEEEFLRHYTVWFLGHIADVVSANDPVGHYTHINPHTLLQFLPEYDFEKLSSILTSWGLSMHYSWHFSLFPDEELVDGVSLMCDIIRDKAGALPFWVTEMQGGNVTMSGSRLICPSAWQTEQLLWTSIAAGAQGMMFWTLNPRRAVMEGGEWALVNYLFEPSDRLQAAASVASAVEANKQLFADAVPVASPLAVLYNVNTMLVQRHQGHEIGLSGRSKESSSISMAATYRALESVGVQAAVLDMETFDYDPAVHPVAVIPNMLSIQSSTYESLRAYVRDGGHLIVTGLSGYYDENMVCSFIGGHPLADVFGGDLLEFKVLADAFDVEVDGSALASHIWKSEIRPASGSEVTCTIDNVPAALRSSYGKGTVDWVPLVVDHKSTPEQLGAFFGKLIGGAAGPFIFKYANHAVNMRLMESGRHYVYVISNASAQSADLGCQRLSSFNPEVIYGNPSIRKDGITVQPHSTTVIKIKK